MRMTNSAASFQAAVEKCLEGEVGAPSYIDDVLIWGDTQEQHDQRICSVYKRLEDEGFRVQESKLILAKERISMLRTILNAINFGLEITPDPDRTKDFLNLPTPANLKKLQQFLGAANYFATYIPHFSSMAEPLFNLKLKHRNFEWTPDCESSFQKIKATVASPQVLVLYDPACPIHLTTDASTVGLGAMLSIEKEGKIRPVAFASKIMTDTERKYSTPEHGALAVVWACEKFDQYLFRCHFTSHFDQQSLNSLLTSSDGHELNFNSQKNFNSMVLG